MPDDSKTDYAHKSFWLETCGDDLTPRVSLEGSTTVDVAIVGGGLSGLWTAYYLAKSHPDLSIAMVERDIVGFGASGRNGGWCTPKFSLTPSGAIRRFGIDTAKRMQAAMYESVDEVERVIQEENLDVHWHRGGAMQVTLGEYGVPILEKWMKMYAALGLESHYQWWDAEEAAAHVRIVGLRAALYNRDTAVLHPGRLVRQLARTVERLGVRIYERTPALRIKAGEGERPAVIETDRGRLEARLAAVIAAEAYVSEIRTFHRAVVPIYSSIVLTEPLADDVWKEIGWAGREAVGSTRLSIDYLQRTADGRILFGGRGEPYHYGSRIKPQYESSPDVTEALVRLAKTWFPVLKDIRFTHAWAGPLGVPRDWLPNLWYDPLRKLAGAWGYVGQGVSTTNLAGRVLAGLIAEKEGEWADLPMVQHTSPPWEPEPLRWLGIRYVQAGLARVDRQAEMTGRGPQGRTLAERLQEH
ncbi:FAD-dependent oxidoreductase [Kyrpidia sp.]|uniref:NAD(P)/FAD-dependent oxidoreductase n=1 Tax=Kyrpidia sp. TaxID=2073077 RepID=UPI00258C4272|nr:FAD-dependent oxidoreductase [Kyrpidia sp.]MCL6574998.1 FAD-binding oxidoreductase [Kyrpidia sp.]